MCTVTIDLKLKKLNFSETLTPTQHRALAQCKRVERDEYSGVYKVAQGAAWQAALQEAQIAVRS